ncbi:unnamed protein product [Spirodela intermedia]|uniref:Uncharacterized protein n=1 Tax=Spirodela intermedia TaxID=51605 RepID=A0A7I8ILB8_SPIIN|nr:unnamed protein product [Spirodela intermedia]CAA6658205.1 unnamed protein product [Spirodela intermedia]
MGDLGDDLAATSEPLGGGGGGGQINKIASRKVLKNRCYLSCRCHSG